ncbi:MAG TPA: helix-turn-helix transcriptional regulator [Chitinophagaceae bacterium]|jgi:transcriptional regulator with XRE-family HTH domain
MNIDQRVGYNIKKLSEKKGYKQGAFAKLLSTSVTTLSGIENGSKDPKLSKLYQIAQVLDVPITDLFAEENENLSPADKSALLDKVEKIISLYNTVLVKETDFEIFGQIQKLLSNQEEIKETLEKILSGK